MIVRKVRCPQVILLIKKGDAEAEQELQVQRNGQEKYCAPEGNPEFGVGEDAFIVSDADPVVEAVRPDQPVPGEARIERKQQRQQHDAQQYQNGRQQQEKRREFLAPPQELG